MDTTREIQESLMNVMQYASNKAVLSSNASCTLECEIIEVVDAGNNQYKIKVNGNNLIAYSQPSTVYKPGDLVQVLFPKGNDQSNGDAIILSAVTPKVEMVIEDEVNNYIDAEESIIKKVNNNEEFSINLQEKKEGDSNIENSPKKQISYLDKNTKESFIKNIKEYQIQKFSVEIRTEIPVELQKNGNYGIYLDIPIKIDNGNNQLEKATYQIYLDINNILGNPYSLLEYSLQEIYVKIPSDLIVDEYLKNPIKLQVFADNFLSEGTQYSSDLKNGTIYFKNFQFNPVITIPDENKTGTYLALVCNTGTIFTENKEEKIIKPILKVNSKDSSVESYECYQFRENVDIEPNSDKYCVYGGSGQECLNDSTNLESDDTNIYQQVTNNYQLVVKEEDIYSSMRFKCVLFKDNKSIVGYITLENSTDGTIKYELKILNKDGSLTDNEGSYIKNEGSVSLIARLEKVEGAEQVVPDFTQQRYNEDDIYIDKNFYELQNSDNSNDNDYQEEKISFPVSKIDNLNIIRCSFYILLGNVKKLVGTAQVMVNTSGQDSYNLVIENSNVLYKYDSDGDSPYSEAYDGSISLKNKPINPLKCLIYSQNDGQELSEEEYKYQIPIEQKLPAESTMFIFEDEDKVNLEDGYYHVYNKRQINYSIANRYNNNAINNDIFLVTKRKKDDKTIVLQQDTDIRFLKEGDSGTNGSKYAGFILYDEGVYGEIKDSYLHKLQLIYIQNKKNRSVPHYLDRKTNELISQDSDDIKVPIKVQVYRDGEILFNNNDDDTYVVEQDMYDKQVTNPLIAVNNKEGSSTDGVVSVLNHNQNPELPTSNIIQAKIIITPKQVEEENLEQIILYAYYPVEVTWIKDENLKDAIPNIQGGFDKVIYDSNGSNPQYNNAEYFYYSNNLDILNGEIKGNKYDQETSGNLQINQNEGIKCKISPYRVYNNKNNLNYVSVILSNEAEINEIEAAIQDKEEQRNIEQEEQHKYENILNAIHSLADRQNYSTIESYYNQSKTYISIRENFYSILKDALKYLEEFKSLCQEAGIREDEYSQYYLNNKNKIDLAKTFLKRMGIDSETMTHSIMDISDFGISEIPNGRFSEYDNIYEILSKYNNAVKGQHQAIADLRKLEHSTTPSEVRYYKEIIGSERVQQEGFKPYLKNYVSTNQDILKEEDIFNNLKELFINDIDSLSSSDDDIFIYTAKDIKKVFVTDQTDLINSKIRYADTTVYDEKHRQAKNNYYALQTQIETLNTQLAFAKSIDSINHFKPIIMICNKNGIVNINEYDGNKVYTDEESNEYITSLQVGSGTVAGDQFTGIVLGNRQYNDNPSKQDAGLFGYSNGQQSIFLDSKTGSATFGIKGKGQIIIDPNNSSFIYGGEYLKESSSTGLIIDLTTPEIKFKSDRFKIDKNGFATIKGNEIEFNTSENYIKSGKHNNLNSKEKGFYIGNNGLSVGKNIKISCTDDNNKIEIGNLANNKYFTIAGDTTKSYISYYENDNNQVYIGTDGIKLGGGFNVNLEGEVLIDNNKAINFKTKGSKLDGTTASINIDGEEYKVFLAT